MVGVVKSADWSAAKTLSVPAMAGTALGDTKLPTSI